MAFNGFRVFLNGFCWLFKARSPDFANKIGGAGCTHQLFASIRGADLRGLASDKWLGALAPWCCGGGEK